MIINEGHKLKRLNNQTNGWTQKSLEEVCGFITKGSTPTTYGFKWEQEGVIFLRSECVSENGLDLDQSMYISEKAHKALIRGEVKNGDILITITGNIGRLIYLDGFGTANINQHIARIRINSTKVNSKFIFYYLSQGFIRVGLNKITTGQAYPQISLKQVREIIVKLPEKEEQDKIALILTEM